MVFKKKCAGAMNPEELERIVGAHYDAKIKEEVDRIWNLWMYRDDIAHLHANEKPGILGIINIDVT